MAKMPFIEEQVSASAARLGGANLGSQAIGSALKRGTDKLSVTAQNILIKRENDRKLEETTSNDRFKTKELELRADLVKFAETSDDISGEETGIIARYKKGFEERFEKHAKDDLGLEPGSDRYQRMRDKWERSHAIGIERALIGDVAQKSTDLTLKNAGEAVAERQKTLIVDPNQYDATLDSGSIYEDLDLAPDLKQKLIKEEFGSYAVASAGELIERAVTVEDLQDLYSDITDKEGDYYKHLSPDQLNKLDNALNIKMKGLKAKSDKELTAYLSARQHGLAKDESMGPRAKAAGKSEQLAIVEKTAEVVDELKTGTIADWNAAAAAAMDRFENSDPLDAEKALQGARIIQTTVDRLKRQLADDRYTFSISTNEALSDKQERINETLFSEDVTEQAEGIRLQQELIFEVDERQKELGVPLSQRRIVGKNNPVREIMAATVATGNVDVMVGAIDMAREAYKGHFDRFMSEVGDDLPPGIMPVIMAETMTDKRLAANIANMSDVELTDAATTATGIEKIDLNAGLDTALKTISSDIYASHAHEFGGPQRAGRNVDMIRRHAKALLVYGKEKTPAKAVATAYNAFFDGVAYAPIANGNVVRVNTKDPGSNPDDIQAGLNSISVDPSILGAERLQLGDQLLGESDKDYERRNAREVRENLVIQNTPDMSAYQFYVQGPDGLIPLRREDGTEVILSPADITDITEFKKFESKRAREDIGLTILKGSLN